MNIIISLVLFLISNTSDLQINVNTACVSEYIGILYSSSRPEAQKSKISIPFADQIRHIKIIKNKNHKRYFGIGSKADQIQISYHNRTLIKSFLQFVFSTYYLHSNSLRAPPQFI